MTILAAIFCMFMFGFFLGFFTKRAYISDLRAEISLLENRIDKQNEDRLKLAKSC